MRDSFDKIAQFFEYGYDCGYFKWHDDPLDKFVSTLLGDLRDVVNRLKTEVRKLKTEKSQLEHALMDAKCSIGDADVYVLDLKAQHAQQMDVLAKEFQRSKKMYKFAIFFCIVCVVIMALKM